MKTVSAIQPVRRLEPILVRSLAVGVAYAVINALAAAWLGSMSRFSLTWDNTALWTLTGTLVGLSLSPFILHSSWPKRRTVLAVWAALALVRSLGTGIEGALYVPATAGYAPLNILAGILTDLLAAWCMVQLIAPAANAGWLNETGAANSSNWRWWDWAWRVLVVGLAYSVFYFVFGSANALLYTLPFYRNNPQYGLAVPPLNSILVAQLVRGPLFGLGALFLAWTVCAPRRPLAVWLGLALFVIGGAAPFVEAVFRTMPLGFNLATLTELLFQNFPTGVAAAYLFSCRPMPTNERRASVFES